jgi:hypothetical protein
MFEPFPLGLSGGRRIDRHGVIEPHLTLALLLRPFLDPRDIAAHSASSRRLGSTENFSPQQSENFKTGVRSAQPLLNCRRGRSGTRADPVSASELVQVCILSTLPEARI